MTLQPTWTRIQGKTLHAVQSGLNRKLDEGEMFLFEMYEEKDDYIFAKDHNGKLMVSRKEDYEAKP